MVRALQQSGQPFKWGACATESAENLRQLGKTCPNVAIIRADLRNGRRAGLQIVRQARVSRPHLLILVLVESPARDMVVEGFRAGADGVFSRLGPFEMLCKCIYAVHEG